MICPHCGRDLIKRKSRHGEFMGCLGFPLCSYTCNTPGSDTAKEKAMKEIEKMGDKFLKDHGFGKNGERG